MDPSRNFYWGVKLQGERITPNAQSHLCHFSSIHNVILLGLEIERFGNLWDLAPVLQKLWFNLLSVMSRVLSLLLCS
jgi:hypothetical protein